MNCNFRITGISPKLIPSVAAGLFLSFLPAVAFAQEPEISPQAHSQTLKPVKSSLSPINKAAEYRPPNNPFMPGLQARQLGDQSQAEIDAIQKIRAQLGSNATAGLGQLLGTTEDTDRQFAEELTRLYLNQESEAASHPQTQVPPDGRLRPLETEQSQNHAGIIDQANNPRRWDSVRGFEFGEQELFKRSSYESPVDYPLASQPLPLLEKPAPLRVANPYSLQPSSLHPNVRSKVTAVRAVAVNLEQAAAELEQLQLYEDADLVRSAANGMWKRARQIETPDAASLSASEKP